MRFGMFLSGFSCLRLYEGLKNLVALDNRRLFYLGVSRSIDDKFYTNTICRDTTTLSRLVIFPLLFHST